MCGLESEQVGPLPASSSCPATSFPLKGGSLPLRGAHTHSFLLESTPILKRPKVHLLPPCIGKSQEPRRSNFAKRKSFQYCCNRARREAAETRRCISMERTTVAAVGNPNSISCNAIVHQGLKTGALWDSSTQWEVSIQSRARGCTQKNSCTI